LFHPLQRAAASVVITHGADKGDVMAQIAGVQGEVERRATQVFGAGKDVPEHFADGDDFHQESVPRRKVSKQVR